MRIVNVLLVFACAAFAGCVQTAHLSKASAAAGWSAWKDVTVRSRQSIRCGVAEDRSAPRFGTAYFTNLTNPGLFDIFNWIP